MINIHEQKNKKDKDTGWHLGNDLVIRLDKIYSSSPGGVDFDRQYKNSSNTYYLGVSLNYTRFPFKVKTAEKRYHEIILSFNVDVVNYNNSLVFNINVFDKFSQIKPSSGKELFEEVEDVLNYLGSKIGRRVRFSLSNTKAFYKYEVTYRSGTHERNELMIKEVLKTVENLHKLALQLNKSVIDPA